MIFVCQVRQFLHFALIKRLVGNKRSEIHVDSDVFAKGEDGIGQHVFGLFFARAGKVEDAALGSAAMGLALRPDGKLRRLSTIITDCERKQNSASYPLDRPELGADFVARVP